jgi:hypothetical protein
MLMIYLVLSFVLSLGLLSFFLSFLLSSFSHSLLPLQIFVHHITAKQTPGTIKPSSRSSSSYNSGMACD